MNSNQIEILESMMPKHLPLSGRDINERIKRTYGRYIMIGTIYLEIQTLRRRGLIELTGEEGEAFSIHYQRFYEITEEGQKALEERKEAIEKEKKKGE